MKTQKVAPSLGYISRLDELGAQAAFTSVVLKTAELSETQRRLGYAAAFLGDGTPFELVAALIGLHVQEAVKAASALMEAGILQQDSSLSFVHPIIRSGVLAQISSLERGCGTRASPP